MVWVPRRHETDLADLISNLFESLFDIALFLLAGKPFSADILWPCHGIKVRFVGRLHC